MGFIGGSPPPPPPPPPPPGADGIVSVTTFADRVEYLIAWDQSLQPGATEWRVNLLLDTGGFVSFNGALQQCRPCTVNPTVLTAPRQVTGYGIHIDIVAPGGTPRERNNIDQATVPALGAPTP